MDRNSLLTELFWPRLCFNGSSRGWIRLWPAGLNWHLRAETDLFTLQCILQKSRVMLDIPSLIYALLCHSIVWSLLCYCLRARGSLLCHLWRNSRLAIHLVHGALAERSVKVLDKWVKLSVNVACAKVVVAGFITANARARLTTNHAKMAPSTNPARTSVKKCLLSAIRLQPTKRDSETARTCSNGLSNLVSVLTAAWRYN